MATVHNEIDNWLAADLHGQLSADERSALHAHLVDCAECRKAHQETKAMNKILEETLAQEKPDPAFEQRMLAGFRHRIPEKSGLLKLLSDLMRLRAAQVTAVAAVLLGLVQLGRMITGETAIAPRTRDDYANEQLFRQRSPIGVAGASSSRCFSQIGRTRRRENHKLCQLAAPHASRRHRSTLQRDFKELPESSRRTGSAGEQLLQGNSNKPEALKNAEPKAQRKRRLQSWQSQTDSQCHRRAGDRQL